MWLAARLATYFPVLFVTGVWAWSYYAYIVVLVGTLIDNVFVAAVYGLTFHMLSFLFLAPYYRAVFEPLPLIQSKFVLSHHEFRRLTHGEPCPDLKDRNLPIKMHDGSGRLRLCTKCKIIKPDRCRHCSICGACVLKFDHHCPWVANCVGFHNYKFFFQFLAYATFFLIFVAATSARYFILYVNGSISSDHGIHMAAMCFIAVVFLFSVGSLFAMHIHLLRRNETTVESMRSQPMFVRAWRKFDLGSGTKNFYQVFGYNPVLWLLPVHSSIGDGHQFQVDVDEELGADGHSYDPYNLEPDDAAGSSASGVDGRDAFGIAAEYQGEEDDEVGSVYDDDDDDDHHHHDDEDGRGGGDGSAGNDDDGDDGGDDKDGRGGDVGAVGLHSNEDAGMENKPLIELQHSE